MKLAAVALPAVVLTLVTTSIGLKDVRSAGAEAKSISCTPFTPNGTVHITAGQSQTFAPDAPFSCSGYSATISPADGTAGFGIGPSCSTTTRNFDSGIGTFKVYGCEEGEVTVSISDGSTVVQTISIVIDPDV